MLDFFSNNEKIYMLERTSKKGTHPRKEKRHTMKKITLKKIITTVRQLEIKKSINDSQFEFYNKKRRRIERKKRRMIEKSSDSKEAVKYYKQNEETLNFCYQFMGKVENENKVINRQIKQYLTNYILIAFVEKLNKLKTFNYKKLDKLISDISTEANKIHNFYNYNNKLIFKENNENIPSWLYIGISNNNIYFLKDYKKYFESHITKKTITKKFSIDDFSQFIKWDIKTVSQEAQEQNNIEADLNNLKTKIEKLISDYNEERKKLIINKDNYNYLILR